MQLCVISENEELYGEVLSVAQQPEYGFDACFPASPDDAARVAEESRPEVVIMDAASGEEDFVALARTIKEILPRTYMIVIADDGSLAIPAFSVHARAYIVKPATDSILRAELDYYVNESAEKQEEPAAVQVMTKGSFEIFINGVPARFKYSKTKKLLEHVISKKGAMVSNDELIKKLWNIDKKNTGKEKLKSMSSYLRNLEADLMRVLTDAGCEDVVIKHWGEIAVAMDKITFIN